MSRQKLLLFGMCVETGFSFRTPMKHLDDHVPVDLTFDCAVGTHLPFDRREDLIASATETNRYGEPAVSVYEIPGEQRMRFPRIADFSIRANAIYCMLPKQELRHMVEICLLGHVMAWYLEVAGIPALHGGALSAGGSAALFLADRGGGKSTLVAYLLGAGYSLLGDDIAAIEQCDRRFYCRPAFPQVKLTPEQADRFAGSGTGGSGTGGNGAGRRGLTDSSSPYLRVHPGFGKLSVPAERIGRFESRALPVKRIYLLDRRHRDSPFELKRIPAGVAIIDLIRSAFLAELVGDLHSMRERRFHGFSRLVQQVPVMRLRYPTGYDALPSLGSLLAADMQGNDRPPLHARSAVELEQGEPS